MGAGTKVDGPFLGFSKENRRIYEADIMECKWNPCLRTERISGILSGSRCRYFLSAGDKEVKKKVERALLPLRVRLRHITLKDYSQPLGVLAGLPDMTPSEEIYDGEELSDTMIVFCGLSNQKLDQALLALKKSGAGPFPYKAILTPTNQHWLAKDCLAELKREHEYMTARGNA